MDVLPSRRRSLADPHREDGAALRHFSDLLQTGCQPHVLLGPEVEVDLKTKS